MPYKKIYKEVYDKQYKETYKNPYAIDEEKEAADAALAQAKTDAVTDLGTYAAAKKLLVNETGVTAIDAAVATATTAITGATTTSEVTTELGKGKTAIDAVVTANPKTTSPDSPVESK